MRELDKHLEDKWTKQLLAAKRVVIKLGTSIVTNEQGDLNLEYLKPIVNDIARLVGEGRQVVLVSSGAIGLGSGHLGLAIERRNDVVMKQACAAVGQSLLMAGYARMFAEHQIKIAQILLTEDDFANWQRYQNLQRTMYRSWPSEQEQLQTPVAFFDEVFNSNSKGVSLWMLFIKESGSARGRQSLRVALPGGIHAR